MLLLQCFVEVSNCWWLATGTLTGDRSRDRGHLNKLAQICVTQVLKAIERVASENVSIAELAEKIRAERVAGTNGVNHVDLARRHIGSSAASAVDRSAIGTAGNQNDSFGVTYP
jgi:hypothetical protein